METDYAFQCTRNYQVNCLLTKKQRNPSSNPPAASASSARFYRNVAQPQGTPHACVTHNANSHACRQASKATGEASCQVRIAVEQVVRLVSSLVDCSPHTLAQALLHKKSPAARAIYLFKSSTNSREPYVRLLVLAEQCTCSSRARTSCTDNDRHDEAVNCKPASLVSHT